MAFNAEILLDLITGPAERQVKKLERSVDRLEQKAGDIDVRFDIDDNEIRRANKLLDNIERTRRVKVLVDERVNRTGSGSGGGSAGAAAALLPGLAAGASASAGITKATERLNASLNSVVEKTQQARLASASFADSQREVLEASSKLESKQVRIAANENKLKELTKQRNIAAGQAQAIQTRINKGQIKNADAIQRSKVRMEEFRATASDLSRKIADAEASQRGLNKETEKYARLAKGLPSTPFRAPGVPPSGGGALPPGGGGRRGRGGGAFGGAAAGGALAGLGGGLARTLAAVVGINEALQETRRILDATLNRTSAEQRLRALSNGWDAYADVVDVASRAAERFNLSQSQAQQQIAQVYGRLRPLGLSLQEVESIYSGFNTASRLSGANAAESAGAFLQLSQALGSGALRGEEFNSVAEQAPAVLSAIARTMDQPIGKLKELAKEGKITRDVVLRALQDIEQNGAARLADVLDTPAQKLQKLNSRIDDLRVELGELSLPAFIGLVEGLTKEIEKITKKVGQLQLAFQGLNRDLKGIQERFDLIANAMPDWGKKVAAGINVAAIVADRLFSRLGQIQLLIDLLAAREKALRGPEPTEYDRTQGADMNMDAIRLMSELYEQTEKVDKATESTAVTGEELIRTLTRQIALQQKLNELDDQRTTDPVAQLQLDRDRELVQLQNDRLSTLDQINTITVEENRQAALLLENNLALAREAAIILNYEQQIAQAKQEQTAAMLEQVGLALQTAGNAQFAAPIENPMLDRLEELQNQRRIFEVGPEAAEFVDRVEALVRQGVDFDEAFNLESAIRDLERMNAQVEEIRDLAEDVASAFTDGVENVFRALIDDTRSAQQALADMFQNLADVFMGAVKDGLNEAISSSITNLVRDIAGLSIETATDAGLTAAVSANATASAANTAALTALTAVDTTLTASIVALTSAVTANTLAQNVPGFANGGTIPMGTTAVVGERGPEIVHTRPNGTIVVPNHRLQSELTVDESGENPYDVARAAMVVSGRTVSSKTAERKEAESEAAIETYFSQGSESRITFDTVRVGELDFVTKDEAMQIGRQSARAAESSVLKGLRNRPAKRGKAGI